VVDSHKDVCSAVNYKVRDGRSSSLISIPSETAYMQLPISDQSPVVTWYNPALFRFDGNLI